MRAIEVFVDKLNLAGLSLGRAVPPETGRLGYHPAMLLKLYLYGHLDQEQLTTTGLKAYLDAVKGRRALTWTLPSS